MADFSFVIPFDVAVAAATEDDTTTGIDDPVDFLLDADGDLDVSAGDVQLVSGIAGVSQSVRSHIQLVLGEWFLDESKGVDYYGQVLVRNPNLLVIGQLFREAILEAPFIGEITRLGIAFNKTTRSADVSWSAKTDFGVITQTTAAGVT